MDIIKKQKQWLREKGIKTSYRYGMDPAIQRWIAKIQEAEDAALMALFLKKQDKLLRKQDYRAWKAKQGR